MVTSIVGQEVGDDYASLSEWEADRDGKSVVDGTEIAQVRAYLDDTSVTIAGFATGCSITIEPYDAAAGPNASWNASAFRMKVQPTDLFAIGLESPNITIRGLQFDRGGTSATLRMANSGSDALIENCIIRDSDHNAFLSTVTQPFIIRNCAIYNADDNAVDGTESTGQGIEYCTLTNCASIGVEDADYVKNSIVIGNENGGSNRDIRDCNSVSYTIYGTIASSTGPTNSNSSVEPTASTTPGASDEWVGFTNITVGSEDLRLIDFTDGETNQAFDAGTPISGVTTDMIGNARDVTTPDCGCLEYQSSSSTIGTGSLDLAGISLMVSGAQEFVGSVAANLPGPPTIAGAADMGMVASGNMLLTNSVLFNATALLEFIGLSSPALPGVSISTVGITAATLGQAELLLESLLSLGGSAEISESLLTGTQQEKRLQSFHNITTSSDPTVFNEAALLAAADAIGATGTYNERMLQLLNHLMSTGHTSLADAQADLAKRKGAANWSSLGDVSTP